MRVARENYRSLAKFLISSISKFPHATAWYQPKRSSCSTSRSSKLSLETGMIKKPVQQVTREIHYDPLADDVRTLITVAWSHRGLMRRATVETMV